MKKTTFAVCAIIFLMSLANSQDLTKLQLQNSITSTLDILKEIEKARDRYGENSIYYKNAMKKLEAKKSRSDFVVQYYNYLKRIERDPDLPDNEKKDWKKLILKQANRSYAKKEKVDEKFLEYHLMTDRFTVLVLRVYEKYENVKTAEDFLNDALTDPDPVAYILRDLRENIKVVKERKYVMKKGETLSGVFGPRWKEIAKYNNITEPEKIKQGQVILIPEQTISIPKYVDKITQFCVLAADKLVSDTQEKIIIAETTLAVHRVESNEGRNIGTGTYHTAMRPSEKEYFLKLCLKLGIDPETAPVSNKPPYPGWGGAMGSAQFLPSTWLVREPDIYLMADTEYLSPYNLKHAILATASMLVASRAASGGSDAERMATMRYLAGKNWDKKGFQFYWKLIKRELDKIRKKKEISKMFKAKL